MKRKILIPALCLCLCLTGCGWLDGSYVSVTAHQEQHQQNTNQSLVASSYQELLAVFSNLISDGTESAVINISGYPADAVERGVTVAIEYAMRSYPIGAYAVSDMDYELGTNNGLPALAVTITYRHPAAQIRAIQTVKNVEAAGAAVARALERYASEVVLLLEDYAQEDYSQLVRAYAEEHPDTVMEIPQVVTNVHGSGKKRVVEMTFTYQNSPENLRLMQSQTKPVFDAAVLYVSGDGQDRQKFAQLYTFLMERFPYQIETSITPAYSLLRHGVGDSKAFAVVYAAMCRKAGLTCLSVPGTCNGEPRTWNIVLDDGNYYHLDLVQCYEDGVFRERTDPEMDGYVWDYSAYPACPPVVTAAPTQEEAAREPVIQVPTAQGPASPTEPTEETITSTEPTVENILENS